jgi:predicted secreted protein
VSLVSSVAVYFVIWWLVLFVVLPFGVRSQHEMDDVTLGTEHGAPHEPYLLRKAVTTTILAGVIFAGVYLFFGFYGMTLEDLLP